MKKTAKKSAASNPFSKEAKRNARKAEADKKTAALRTEFARRERKALDLETGLEVHEREITKKKESLPKLDRKIVTANNKLTALNKKMEALKRKHLREMDKMQRSIDAATRAVTAAENAKTKTVKSIDTATKRIPGMQKRIDTAFKMKNTTEDQIARRERAPKEYDLSKK